MVCQPSVLLLSPSEINSSESSASRRDRADRTCTFQLEVFYFIGINSEAPTSGNFRINQDYKDDLNYYLTNRTEVPITVLTSRIIKPEEVKNGTDNPISRVRVLSGFGSRAGDKHVGQQETKSPSFVKMCAISISQERDSPHADHRKPREEQVQRTSQLPATDMKQRELVTVIRVGGQKQRGGRNL
nr:hypothetical protein Iba_chr09dCG5910 [Ipomoea batatas]